MKSDLKSKTLSAGLWSFSGSSLQTLVQLAISITLARLLTPEDFGLLAMILLFPEIGRVLAEGGFGIALIHRKNSTKIEETSVLCFNFTVAVVFFSIIYFSAPAVANFYKQPELVDPLRLSGIGLIFTSLATVQISLLSRELNFRSQTIISLVSTLLAGALAMALAYLKYGVWALVWQGVAYAIFNASLLWLFSSWRPVFGFSFRALRSMSRFGLNMLFTNIVSIFFGNLGTILIGRFYSPSELGYFNRAQSFQAIPINAFSFALSRVILPSLVQINDDPERLKNAYTKMMNLSIGLIAPAMCVCIFLATPLIDLVFSSKWLPAVPYFQIFCIGGIFYPLHVLNINILLALGRPDLHLYLEILKNILSLITFLVAVHFGIYAMALGVLLISLLALLINSYFPGKLTGLTLFVQLRNVLPYLLSAAVPLFIGRSLVPIDRFESLVCLLLFGPLFFIAYFSFTLLIPNNIFFYFFKSFVHKSDRAF